LRREEEEVNDARITRTRRPRVIIAVVGFANAPRDTRSWPGLAADSHSHLHVRELGVHLRGVELLDCECARCGVSRVLFIHRRRTLRAVVSHMLLPSYRRMLSLYDALACFRAITIPTPTAPSITYVCRRPRRAAVVKAIDGEASDAPTELVVVTEDGSVDIIGFAPDEPGGIRTVASVCQGNGRLSLCTGSSTTGAPAKLAVIATLDGYVRGSVVAPADGVAHGCALRAARRRWRSSCCWGEH
jgi:hypothetical protein